MQRLDGEKPAKFVPGSIAIIVPTCRPERLERWWNLWTPDFFEGDRPGAPNDVTVYVILDAPERESLSVGAYFRDPDLEGRAPASTMRSEVYSWAEIDAALGADSWIIPRRSDAIRSFGFLKAYRNGAEFILSLDDDCLPDPKSLGSWVDAHLAALRSKVEEAAWASTIKPLRPRGFPYGATTRSLPVAINHGGWNGVLDLDAPTRLALSRDPARACSAEFGLGAIRRGEYAPLCGMNLAFRAEFAPAMYQLLMGAHAREAFALGGDPDADLARMERPRYPFDRFADIWSGVLAKKIADHLGFAVTTGGPFVVHEGASDPLVNLGKEAAGIRANETFWRAVDAVPLGGETVAECYLEVANWLGEGFGVEEFAPGYATTLREAMRAWVRVLGDRKAPDPVPSVVMPQG